jgi:hypothetical protein
VESNIVAFSLDNGKFTFFMYFLKNQNIKRSSYGAVGNLKEIPESV